MTVYLLAHGSADPRHADDVGDIAERLAVALGDQVRACYLDLCPPSLAAAADHPGVVVPVLFSPGYHVQVDVAQAVAGAPVRLRVAAPPLLTGGAAWARALLAEVGPDWPGRRVVPVTAGTRDAGVSALWSQTSAALGVPVAHVSGLGPRIADLELDPARDVVLPLLVARGYFADQIASQAAPAGIAVAPVAGRSRALVAQLARSARAAEASQPDTERSLGG